MEFSDFSEIDEKLLPFAPGAENALNYQGFWSQKEQLPPKKNSYLEKCTFSQKVQKVWFSWNLVKIAKFSDFHDFGLQNHQYSLVLAVFFAFGEKSWILMIFT